MSITRLEHTIEASRNHFDVGNSRKYPSRKSSEISVIAVVQGEVCL